jgi:hypothetical protein
VSITMPQEEASSGGSKSSKREPRLRMANVKLLTILFMIIMTVNSGLFVNSVLSGFGPKAVRCRTATSWGKVLISIFIVLFYILAIYLSEHGIV